MSEDKKQLVRYFKRSKCNKCAKEAYYMPTHGGIVCLECSKIPEVDVNILDPMAYISEEAKKELKDRERNKFSIVYRSPEDDPLRDFPNRNEKCSCGSGLKFKKCCLPRFKEIRNEEAEKMFNKNRASSIISAANAVRLVNMIKTYFDNNKDKNEIPTTELGFFPFIDMEGNLKEVDILSTAKAGMDKTEVNEEDLKSLVEGESK